MAQECRISTHAKPLSATTERAVQLGTIKVGAKHQFKKAGIMHEQSVVGPWFGR
jgi:hypothetical protein